MDEVTIATYNEFAGQYDASTADFWSCFPRVFIERLFKESGGARVLNIGSGPGADALLLRAAGFEVVCLDGSEVMVERCLGLGFESVCSDFNSLPFVDGSFDAVWAYTSLLHVPKSEILPALKEILRVLKVGGVVALGFIEGDFEGYVESGSMLGSPRWFSYYSEGEIETLMLGLGFERLYFDVFAYTGKKTKNYLHFIFKK